TAGSLGRAAEQLGMTQPALTKAIQRLESRLGVVLFHRTPRGLELTEAGQGFLKRSQVASGLMEDAVQEARDVGGGHAGLLRLGMSPASAHFVLNALFPRLRQERPAAVLQLQTAFGDTLLDALLRRELHMAVCPLPADLPPEVEAEALYDDAFSLVCHESHPLASQTGPLDLAELLQHEFAASGKHEFARQMIERVLAKAGLPLPRVVVEANTLEALVHIVASGGLVTVLPRQAMPPQAVPRSLVWRPVELPGARRQIGVIRPRHTPSSMAQRATELLRSAAASGP
ncbi:MAG TPA: LysR family transcriptional regulator, partial [Candidatus Aquabacterium excrementipullorum]|nr:LysR family transcriptional regulator [Candidatus Aquabacterium excrementipullorum]